MSRFHGDGTLPFWASELGIETWEGASPGPEIGYYSGCSAGSRNTGTDAGAGAVAMVALARLT